jgi:hypothetical protein
VGSRYDHLNREEMLRLLEARDQRDATRFGLVWEANEIERDQALNNDFVALDLDREKCVGTAPWRNLLIEGDNYDVLRYGKLAMKKLFTQIQGSSWMKPVGVILIVAVIVLLWAREESKSLFRSDSNLLRSLENRWTEAGRPSGTNLDSFLGDQNFFVVSNQTFLVGTQKFQTIFTLKNPRVNWKGGQVFVTTNNVLIWHKDDENRVVHWIKIWPCFDMVNLRDKN